MNYRPGDQFECKRCGEEFELSRYTQTKPKYCSRDCSDAMGRKSTSERVKVTCEVCEQEEMVYPTRAESYRTCSRECRSELQSNERSPNYDWSVPSGEVGQKYENGESISSLVDEYDTTRKVIRRRLQIEEIDLDHPASHSIETNRGEKVRSEPEEQVANWLHDHGIDYEYEPDIEGPYIPDFMADGLIIEVWGWESDEYEDRRQSKTEWYRNNGYAVLGVKPGDELTEKQICV